MSHGLLTNNQKQSFDLLTMHGYVPTQKATKDNTEVRERNNYIKRERPKKLDLDLTVL